MRLPYAAVEFTTDGDTADERQVAAAVTMVAAAVTCWSSAVSPCVVNSTAAYGNRIAAS